MDLLKGSHVRTADHAVLVHGVTDSDLFSSLECLIVFCLQMKSLIQEPYCKIRNRTCSNKILCDW